MTEKKIEDKKKKEREISHCNQEELTGRLKSLTNILISP